LKPKSAAVLLDTCAVIWLGNGDPLAAAVVERIVAAGLSDGVLVSPVSAWEIGMLSKPRPGGDPAVRFLPDPKTWFARFSAGPGIKEATFTPAIAIDASWLPGELHNDPGDRLIIATARALQCPIITRDSKIISYGETGHVEVIAC
jgi:PIN domain nuclease of toxin-antitoxin system